MKNRKQPSVESALAFWRASLAEVATKPVGAASDAQTTTDINKPAITCGYAAPAPRSRRGFEE